MHRRQSRGLQGSSLSIQPSPYLREAKLSNLIVVLKTNGLDLTPALHASYTMSASSSAGGKPSSSASSSSASRVPRNRALDPITRTALRYTISPREYALLHQYLISRAPRRVQKQTPDPPQYENSTANTSETSDYNAAALRAALRTFIATYVGMKGYEAITTKIAARRSAAATAAAAAPVIPPKVAARPTNPNARLALSFSMIMLFHRIFHRFFRRLRGQLLQDSAEPFRKRNPGIARLLTSSYTPAVGASLAGFFLNLAPAEQLRMTLAIYVLSRSLEFGYNALEDSGMLWKKKEGGEEGSGRPWWFGSWMIMPVVCGQLLHAFVFDRDCFPESYGRFILSRSPEYIQLRPASYTSTSKPWPGTFDIVDALAELSKLKWPAFVSPILFPAVAQTLPKGAALSRISPITAPAHPALTHTSCAILHPHDPSCARTYLKFWLAAFPSVTKFFTLVHGAFALLAYKALLRDPIPAVNRLAARVLRMSLFITGAIGTSWASICLFATVLPPALLPTQRWFLGGFLGGLWALVARSRERSTFLYSARLSLDSVWKVGRKRGWWKGLAGGDVLVFTGSLALLGAVYEAQPTAVRGPIVRKALGVLRGEGWVDRAALAEDEKTKKDA
nr:hypothetical protein CFP56_62911 [Quercus suber]